MNLESFGDYLLALIGLAIGFSIVGSFLSYVFSGCPT